MKGKFIKNETFLCFVFFIFSNSIVATDFKNKIKIVSCEDNKAITDVIVTNGTFVIGISDSEGFVELDIDSPLKEIQLKKMGYRDTTIQNLNKSQEFCLSIKDHQLPEVRIQGSDVNFEDQFEYYIEKTSKRMLNSLDTIYYSYNYSISVPDSNWNITMNGVLKLPYKPYNKRRSGVWDSRYCKLEAYVDSSFWHDPIIRDIIGLRMAHFINFDPMRKGNFLRKKLKNKTKVSKFNDSLNQIFDIQTKKGLLITASFNEDSILSEYESIWLDEAYENGKISFSSTNIQSAHSIFKYRTKNPIVFTLLQNKSTYKFENKTFYSVELKMKLLDNKANYKNCLNHTILIDINREYFKENNLKFNFK